MKLSIFILLVVVGLTQFVQAQSKKTLYYSKHWEITTHDSAYYYRLCQLDTVNYQFIGEVNDFLLNDRLIMKGSYSNGKKNGKFTSYYSNGQVESQGEFRDDKRLGVWEYYFSNEKLERNVTFKEDDFFVNSSYDVSGDTLIENGTGDWSYTYEWIDLPFNITVTGRFVDGKKEGEWRCTSSKGDLLYTEKFFKNRFKEGFSYDTGKKIANDVEFQNKFLLPYKFDVTEKFMYLNFVNRLDYPFLNFLPAAQPIRYRPNNYSDSVGNGSQMIYTIVEEQATFPGGLAAFYEDVARNIKYPKEAKRLNIQGKILVEFIINIDGTLSELKCIQGIGGGCDEEAIRVVSRTSPWVPAKQRGKPVRSKFVININFRLQ